MNLLTEIFNIFWLTFLPLLELRASIPYGILKGSLHWSLVFIVAVTANIILGIIVYLLIGKIVVLAKKIKFVNRIYQSYVERTQKQISSLVEKYGEFALAIFIGIPLPASGVYSGALAAYLLGMKFRKFFVANIIGVVIAGVIVTIVTLTGVEAFQVFVKYV